MSQPLIESMSGTRGIVGENLHPNVALEIAMAFGSFLGKGPVVVGADTRVSYAMLHGAVVSGLTAVGISVIDIGQVPTPTVQQMVTHFKAMGGMVITASHNPIMWNGIKLMDHTGSFLTESAYQQFMAIRKQKQVSLAAWDRLGTIKSESNAITIHVQKILSCLNVKDTIRRAKFRVLVDPNHGTGCLANPILFEQLGVDYDMINSEPHGIFAHNPEPLETNLQGLVEKMKTGGYTIGFAQDADADRLVIVAENGWYIGEDYSLAFCIDYLLSQETGAKKNVVVNLSTSRIIEWVARQYQAQVTYTRIGEPFVTAKLKETHAQVGGEGNGGVIYPKIGWGRDSLVGMTVALLHLAQAKKSVSEIVSQYPKFVMLRDKFTLTDRSQVPVFLAKLKQAYSTFEMNDLDGLKIMLPEGWIHARPSNTEPILRIFIEAPTAPQAAQYMQAVKRLI